MTQGHTVLVRKASGANLHQYSNPQSESTYCTQTTENATLGVFVAFPINLKGEPKYEQEKSADTVSGFSQHKSSHTSSVAQNNMKMKGSEANGLTSVALWSSRDLISRPGDKVVAADALPGSVIANASDSAARRHAVPVGAVERLRRFGHGQAHLRVVVKTRTHKLGMPRRGEEGQGCCHQEHPGKTTNHGDKKVLV